MLLLAKRGAYINTVDNTLTSPLKDAAVRGDVEMVKLLVELGADMTKEDLNGRTPLHNAVIGGSVECVKALVEAGADRCCNLSSWLHSLILAILEDRKEIGQYLVSKNAEGKESDHNIVEYVLQSESEMEGLRSPLFQNAALFNNVKLMRYLKERQQVNVNEGSPKEYGRAPAIFAAINGSIDALAELLKMGADLNLAVTMVLHQSLQLQAVAQWRL